MFCFFLVNTNVEAVAISPQAVKVRVQAVQGFSEKYRSEARMIFPKTALAAPTLLRR
jgi:hypothetical protein